MNGLESGLVYLPLKREFYLLSVSSKNVSVLPLKTTRNTPVVG